MMRWLPLSLVIASGCFLSGCGPRLKPVTGTVTLDGKPVDGASVTFLSDDGKNISAATTDETGHFELMHTTGPGAFPGAYKVTVTKYPKVEAQSPDVEGSGKMDKQYEQAMKKQMEASKKSSGGKMTGATFGAGIAPPGGMMPVAGGSAGSSAKSQLPEVYASIDKTPFTITVPVEGPVQLDLKSK